MRFGLAGLVATGLVGAGTLGLGVDEPSTPPSPRSVVADRPTGFDSLPSRPLGLDLYMPVPADNPLTPARAALGERLFFDSLLSRDRSLACASCHRPEYAFGDTLPVARGVGGTPGIRNAPPLVNRAWAASLFWDGRVVSLEEQALHPVESPQELDLPLDVLVSRLREDPTYVRTFRDAFPGEAHPLGPDGVARALASFVRTLQFGGAPIDRHRAGDADALGEAARRGGRLFFGRAGCGTCHTGPTFSDGEFHNTGVSWGSPDLGRHRVTGRDEDRGRFRTATLRELVRSAPYMHDGRLATLEEVVDFYDRGGTPNPLLSPGIRPLGLTAVEKADLVAFLRALSSDVADVTTR